MAGRIAFCQPCDSAFDGDLPLAHHHPITDHGDVEDVAAQDRLGLLRNEDFRPGHGLFGAGHEIGHFGLKGEPMGGKPFDSVAIA
jgi:hypothetical protein